MPASARRELMVETQIRARGIHDPRVLAAMREVPREAFLPPALEPLAYEDRALPIEANQTISQPYIVALMIDALGLRADDDVLEVGTGSGYAAAVLARVARRVYTIERIPELAELARTRFAELGYATIEVKCDDGTLGWPEHAPYSAIVVTAGGPSVPRALLAQLAIGGRLVMPVGPSRAQQLVRVTRINQTEVQGENLGEVMFVPLIGKHGWAEQVESRVQGPLIPARPVSRGALVAKLVAECAEPITRIEDASMASLLEQIGDARVVLLGEATHGTSEFYRMRTRITQQLILRAGFTAVAVEADWPDAAVVDRYVRNAPPRPTLSAPLIRFPAWMWRNRETQALVEWLRAYNLEHASPERVVTFAGLDLYSLFVSADEVVQYLDRVDPIAARAARARYGRLTPWQNDPAAYGHAAHLGRMQSCETEVVEMLRDLLASRLEYALHDGEAYFDAAQNARVVAGAEHFYRAMFHGGPTAWNLRDQHMFDTLRAILAQRGDPDAKVVVWAHNSHVGDAAATEMAARGEHNLGQLCRTELGRGAFLVGFGMDHGVVAAAHEWGEPMDRMLVRPARAESYERLCHEAAVPAFLLALRDPVRGELRDELIERRLERAIGVVYHPERELQSHYFQASLPAQFDAYVWFDETTPIDPLPRRIGGVEEPAPDHPLLGQ
ncbi:MAG: protein-L-isoaspartate(D-aspartate) O-methyltransferase [Deltaproteobacteria bacterium]|nr:protein-L-isoaspartate(D-aspartate) O-methyltransferase [Deltaproteobacteria bacterium]